MAVEEEIARLEGYICLVRRYPGEGIAADVERGVVVHYGVECAFVGDGGGPEKSLVVYVVDCRERIGRRFVAEQCEESKIVYRECWLLNEDFGYLDLGACCESAVVLELVPDRELAGTGINVL